MGFGPVSRCGFGVVGRVGRICDVVGWPDNAGMDVGCCAGPQMGRRLALDVAQNRVLTRGADMALD